MGKIVVAPEWSGCSWCSHGGAAPAGAAGAAGRVQDPRPSRAAFPGIEETPRLAPKRRRKKGKRRNDMNVPRGCRGAKKTWQQLLQLCFAFLSIISICCTQCLLILDYQCSIKCSGNCEETANWSRALSLTFYHLSPSPLIPSPTLFRCPLVHWFPNSLIANLFLQTKIGMLLVESTFFQIFLGRMHGGWKLKKDSLYEKLV